MALKRVGIDIDNTAARTNERIVHEYNVRHGTSHTIKDMRSWHASGWTIPMSKEEFYELYGVVWGRHSHSIAPTVDAGLMARLLEGHDVGFLTHRDEGGRHQVVSWGERNFPGLNIGVRCVAAAELKLFAGYSTLVDDGNPLAEEFIRLEGQSSMSTRTLILVEQPWNVERRYWKRSSNIIPVKDLGSGIELLLRSDCH